MRVLHASGGDVYGGIERMLAAFAATKSIRLEQQFAVSASGRLHRELRDLGARVVSLPHARASRPQTVLAARRVFSRLLEELKPDAAIFHGSWTHAIFAPVARKRTAVLGFWQHAPVLNGGWPDRWASWTRPDVLIANSRFTASVPVFSGIAPRIIHCPVLPIPSPRASDRAAGRRQLGAGDSDVVVLMAARLEAWKGHSILIDVAKRLPSASMKFWIAGGVQRGSEQAYFDQLAREVAGHSHSITLLGQRDDVGHLMTLADLYCQPNTAPEPFGLAIAEAMRAGLPCVVSRSGGATELVDRHSGVLTRPGDAADVATALASLAANRQLRLDLGAAARVRAGMLTDPAARIEDLADALNFEPVRAAAESHATVV